MLLFLQKCINYGYVARYAYIFNFIHENGSRNKQNINLTNLTKLYIDICLRSRQLKQLPNLFELFVKQNSNTFVFDLKQFSEITIVREHKRVWVVWPSEITPYVFAITDLVEGHVFPAWTGSHQDVVLSCHACLNCNKKQWHANAMSYYMRYTQRYITYSFDNSINIRLIVGHRDGNQYHENIRERRMTLGLQRTSSTKLVIKSVNLLDLRRTVQVDPRVGSIKESVKMFTSIFQLIFLDTHFQMWIESMQLCNAWVAVDRCRGYCRLQFKEM